MIATPAPTRKPVLIIGAGLSGLATARLLTYHHIPNIVFEASSADRSQGYSITLRDWAYKPLLAELGGVSTDTLERAIAPDRHLGGRGWIDQALRDVSTGKTLLAPPEPEGPAGTSDRAVFRANRNALRTWLRDGGEREVDVRYEHKLKSIQGEVGNAQVQFENGVRMEGSLIVAADGLHSTVRQQILAHIHPEVIPAVVFHGDIRLSLEEFNAIVKPAIGDSNILAGVGDNFNTPITISNITDEHVDLDWSYSRGVRGANDPLFHPSRSQDEAREIPKELLNELESAKLVPPFSHVLSAEQIRKNGLYNWLSRSVFIPRPGLDAALRKSVVFIGDSAHGMPIFGGEGGNHALLDAVELTRALRDSGVPSGEVMSLGANDDDELEMGVYAFYDGAYKRCEDAVRRSRQRFNLLHRPIAQWRMVAEQSKRRCAAGQNSVD